MQKDYKELKEKYPNLSTYLQLGLEPISEQGKQVICNCLFCGAEKKLYVNKDNKLFDCKVCGVEGGFETFVKTVLAKYKKECSSRELSKLARAKNVQSEILEFFKADNPKGYKENPPTFINLLLA